MSESSNSTSSINSKQVTDLIIRLSLIAVLIYFSLKVLSPFIGLVIWGLILAVALFPLHQKVANILGGRNGRASTALVLLGAVLLGLPSFLLSSVLVDEMKQWRVDYQEERLEIPAPKESVAEWPVIGGKVFKVWTNASEDFPAFLEENEVIVDEATQKGVSMATSLLKSLLFFLVALVLAGVFMAYAQSGGSVTTKFLSRVAGDSRGPAFVKLCVGTTRSVAVGVIGVALIQAIILGLGLLVAGTPFPGILALAVFILGILQLPGLIISLPAIIYLWSSGDGSVVMNSILTVYLLVAGIADNILKPFLLGRGVDAPMPVILIGALGGMATSGFVGLFLGAVILTVSYRLLMDWLNGSDEVEPEVSAEA